MFRGIRDEERPDREQAEREAYYENTWGIVRRVADYYQRIYLVTRSGQILNPRRATRSEAERAGLAPTGRQWVKLRKMIKREERRMAAQKAEAAA